MVAAVGMQRLFLCGEAESFRMETDAKENFFPNGS